jgi:hypothetical protein
MRSVSPLTPRVSPLGVKTAHPTRPDPWCMTHPGLTTLVARDKFEDLDREAARKPKRTDWRTS